MALGTVYTAATGMLTFSKGLDVVSNNVANLNTPGFKRSDLLFRDLFFQYSQSAESNNQLSNQQTGAGVTDAGTVISFEPGEIQQTGNDTDVAINGNGFFVLRDGDQNLFTRAGQFEFDDEGFLVNSSLGLRVAGLNENNELIEININDFRTNPPQPTTEVTFSGILSSGNDDFEMSIEVIDSLGELQTLRAVFTNNRAVTPRSWLIDIFDGSDAEIASDLEIRFQEGSGAPEVGFNTVQFDISSDEAGTDTITFNFGEPGSTTQTTYASAGSTSDLSAGPQTGVPIGSLLELEISESGLIEAVYSNEERADVGRLALAWFNELQSLRQIGNGVFLVTGEQQPIIGRAAEGVLGDVIGGSIEISNVELTQEFTDLIIIQRGFQASSQIMSTANEMIQELITAGKGQ